MEQSICKKMPKPPCAFTGPAAASRRQSPGGVYWAGDCEGVRPGFPAGDIADGSIVSQNTEDVLPEDSEGPAVRRQAQLSRQGAVAAGEGLGEGVAGDHGAAGAEDLAGDFPARGGPSLAELIGNFGIAAVEDLPWGLGTAASSGNSPEGAIFSGAG